MQPKTCIPFFGSGNYRSISCFATRQPYFIKPQHCDYSLTTAAAASSLATEMDGDDAKINPSRSKVQQKGKDSSRKKSSQPKTSVRLLQLRDPVTQDILEQSFEDMALKTELSKLKLFVKLKNKLVDSKRKKSSEAVKSSSLWDVTKDFLDRQKTLPLDVKTAFWSLILAPTSSSSQISTNVDATTIVVPPQHVDILLKAREVAVHRPLFWNDKHKHAVLKQYVSDKKSRQGALPLYRSQRSEQLIKIHEAKSQQQLRDEATALAQHLSSKLPSTQYKKVCKTLQEFVNNNPIRSETSTPARYINKKYGIHETYSLPLVAAAKEHYHLVAEQLVEFLYLNVDSTETTDSSTTTDKVMDILSYDNKIEAKADNWIQTKEECIAALQSIQSLLIQEHEQSSKRNSSKGSDDQLFSTHDHIDGSQTDKMLDDEWLSDDEEEDDEDYDEDEDVDDDDNDCTEADRVYDDSDESVAETFYEVSRLTPVEKDKKKVIPKKRRYIAFEALSVGGVASYELVLPKVKKPSKASAAVFPPPTDRLIFIDNLPIDVTEDTLVRAYSRCGPIESIQIFQQRPDLDPGRKVEDSKKKIRKPSSIRSLWERPRTPLYATILYRDANGASKATVDSLRIFGMVLDKHLIRSYAASSMTKLYLEDMSAEHDVTSMEATLSQILHPNLYVCLDVEQQRQKRFPGPSHCVVRFPDFASAYWAYSKLSAELPCLKANDECQLHWMPTPGDAELYWTRKLNY
jgi:hypothetical protein